MDVLYIVHVHLGEEQEGKHTQNRRVSKKISEKKSNNNNDEQVTYQLNMLLYITLYRSVASAARRASREPRTGAPNAS